MRRRLLIGLGLSAGIAAAVCSWWVGLPYLEPSNHPVELPTDLPAEVVSLPGNDHAIAAWWLDQGDGTPVVLLLHPVRSDRSSMATRARLLSRHGFSVLVIDLQGHGETPGDAITFGSLESSDVRSALSWVRRTMPSRRVGAISCSLGGAAILLGPQPAGFDAVVLEAVYPRISKAIENRVRIRVGPLAPILTPLLLLQLRFQLGLSPQDLEPIRAIDRLGAPVLLIAGSNDEHTTLPESMELYRAAASPKRLWVVEGARHEDFLSFDPRAYEREVVDFLRQHLGTTQPAIDSGKEAPDIGELVAAKLQRPTGDIL